MSIRNFSRWPFKMGTPFLAIVAGATGFFVNRTFRNALYLQHLSRLSSYVATIGVPTFTSGLFHGLVRAVVI
jgi:hypothetical protein